MRIVLKIVTWHVKALRAFIRILRGDFILILRGELRSSIQIHKPELDFTTSVVEWRTHSHTMICYKGHLLA